MIPRARLIPWALLSFAVACSCFQATAKTTISMMTWTLSSYDVDGYKRLCAAFEKQEPTIKVKLMNQAWAGETAYLTKLLTMATGNVAPDIVRSPFAVLPTLAQAGILADLGPLMARDKQLRLTDWTEAGIESASWKARVYGLPHLQSNWWVTFNPTVFLEAGVMDPEALYANGSWDFDSMISAAQKTTKVDASGVTQRWGLVTILGLNEGLLPFIRGMGGKVFSADGSKCLLGEKGAVDGVSLVYSLIFNKKVLPAAFDLVTVARQSKLAMLPWWSDTLSFFYSQKVAWKPNQVPFPVGPGSKATVVSQAHVMTITKQSAHKQEAYKFLKFACGEVGSLMMAEVYESNVPHKKAQEEMRRRLIAQGVTGARFGAEADGRTLPVERSLRYQTVFPAIETQLARIFQKKVSAADGLAQAAKNATADLARSRK